MSSETKKPANPPEFTDFGHQLGSGTAIGELMQDLGEALANGGDGMVMLGGGQPAHIPEVDALWRERMEQILAEPGSLESMLGNYDPPGGNSLFCERLADLLKTQYGWDVCAENIAVTTGGQTAFFFLFNMLAGEGREIVLPLVPEYIGYASQLTAGGHFRAVQPAIEQISDHEFKYRVDFDALDLSDKTAAVCVSRPTNPTGNVLTDGEVERLREATRKAGVPLIIDNAYGAPFPLAIFSEVQPVWDENIILTFSLSKLGLPGTRTGIVVARPEIAAALRSMTATVGLANGNVGQAIVSPLVKNGELLRLSRETIRPFYKEKSQMAVRQVHESFAALKESRYQIHRSEGALFLWLWFPGLPITSRELYQRLKKRSVLIVPGEPFFFGLPDDLDWPHRHECLRMTFTMPAEQVQRGITIIAEEVHAALTNS